MDIEYYNEKWEKLKSRSLEEEGLYWDQRAEGFNKSVVKEADETRTKKLVDYFKSKGVFHEDTSILDIGCGPGAYSIAFSPLVKKIEAIDISSEMLAYAKSNLEKRNIKNVDMSLLSWEEIDIEKLGWSQKFDLVFASMSPGINNMETLLKMSKASRGHCFMSSFASREDKLLDGIRDYVYGENLNSKWGEKIHYAYNILWKAGYFPEISYTEYRRTTEHELEDAIKRYTDHIQRPGEADITDKVREYFEVNFKDGKIVNESEVRIAWIYWKVKDFI